MGDGNNNKGESKTFDFDTQERNESVASDEVNPNLVDPDADYADVDNLKGGTGNQEDLQSTVTSSSYILVNKTGKVTAAEMPKYTICQTTGYFQCGLCSKSYGRRWGLHNSS